MRHAFTLIEVMIVIAIIALIAAIAVPEMLANKEAQTATVATPPAPAWSQERVLNGTVDTVVVKAPDGQQWVVFHWTNGTAALPYTPKPVPAGTALQVEKQ